MTGQRRDRSDRQCRAKNGTLTNNASLKASGTGNALHNETITNAATGTIEVLADGALTIDQGSTVANSGNVTVDADGNTTVNGATITGGTVTDNGEIDLTGISVLKDGTLTNNATLKASGTGNALTTRRSPTPPRAPPVLANGALTIGQGSTSPVPAVVTVNATGMLAVGSATIDGGTVTGNGEIDLNGSAVAPETAR